MMRWLKIEIIDMCNEIVTVVCVRVEQNETVIFIVGVFLLIFVACAIRQVRTSVLFCTYTIEFIISC